MCFSEPGRITAIDGPMVRVETVDGDVDASLRIMQAAGRCVEVGDWVLMSLGLVIEVVDEVEGRRLLEQLRDLRAFEVRL